MKPLDFRSAAYLTLDVALLAVCLLHVPYLLQRPALPFEARMSGGAVTVERVRDPAAAGTLKPGESIVRWENERLTEERELEFLTDFRAIGSTVVLGVEGNGGGRDVQIRLIPFYGVPYILIVLFVGIITWGVGVYIMVARPHEPAAGVLQWSLVCMGVSTMLAWGATPLNDVMPLLGRGLFFVVYMGVGSLFFLFTTMFPRPRYGRTFAKAAVIGIVSLIVLIPLLATHLGALTTGSTLLYARSRLWFDVFQVLKLLLVGGGLFNVISAYVTTVSAEERKRLQWILWGLAIGPLPFLGLITIPEFFRPSGLVPEEATLIFLVLIPIAFAISFVKYHVLDVELVIKRTTVYGFVLAAVIGVYTLILGTVSAYVGAFARGASVVAAVLIALLFEPLRRGVQRFVDRKFFRVQYDFREAGKRFLADIERALDEKELGELLVRRTADVLPVERIGLFLNIQPAGRLHTFAHRGFDAVEGRGIPFGWGEARSDFSRPLARTDLVEAGVDITPGDAVVFRRWGMGVVFPVPGEQASTLGFLVLGPKMSGVRFSAEDIDLFAQVAAETGLALERIGASPQPAPRKGGGAETRGVEQAQVRLRVVRLARAPDTPHLDHDVRGTPPLSPPAIGDEAAGITPASSKERHSGSGGWCPSSSTRRGSNRGGKNTGWRRWTLSRPSGRPWRPWRSSWSRRDSGSWCASPAVPCASWPTATRSSSPSSTSWETPSNTRRSRSTCG